MRYTIFACIQKLTNSQLSLPHGTKQKWVTKKLKTKVEMLRRNGPVQLQAQEQEEEQEQEEQEQKEQEQEEQEQE